MNEKSIFTCLGIGLLLLISGHAEAQETRPFDPARFFRHAGFGLGASLTLDTGNRDRVESARIVGGVVRIDKDDDARSRFMLETHVFPWTFHNDTIGAGLFFGLQPGGDNIIDTFGGGVMFGFKPGRESDVSLNIGIGVVVDPGTRVLGDGFAANQPPPAGETEVRFKETEQVGILIIASYGFNSF